MNTKKNRDETNSETALHLDDYDNEYDDEEDRSSVSRRRRRKRESDPVDSTIRPADSIRTRDPLMEGMEGMEGLEMEGIGMEVGSGVGMGRGMGGVTRSLVTDIEAKDADESGAASQNEDDEVVFCILKQRRFW